MTDSHSHRLFAAVYDTVMARAERRFLADERRALVSDADGRVLELGTGTGANLKFYPSNATVHAVEPDVHMLRRARRRADEALADVSLVRGVGESLPYADDRFDCFVCPVVLCTVDDLDVTLAEARRVLRDGGELRFLEHVHADGAVGRAQETVNPLWHRVAAGCNLNRDTAAAIEDRFGEVEYEEVGSTGPARPFVRGRATLP